MTEDLIIAGFGGQGVMRMGQMLAYSGLMENKNVLWVPAYGPETRGGFANCTVIVSDEEIGSPVISRPKSVIVLNLPSLDKFEDAVLPGGTLVVNTSLVNREPRRSDITVIKVPATDIATDCGNTKAANIVALGAFLAAVPLVSKDSIFKSLEKLFGSKHHVVELNKTAFERGSEIGREQVSARI